MSTQDLSDRMKETWKSVKEQLEKANARLEKEIGMAAPGVKKSLRGSYESASKGFNSSMKAIDGATEPEQVRLLQAYKRLLTSQLGFVDERLREIEARTAAKESNVAVV